TPGVCAPPCRTLARRQSRAIAPRSRRTPRGLPPATVLEARGPSSSRSTSSPGSGTPGGIRTPDFQIRSAERGEAALDDSDGQALTSSAVTSPYEELGEFPGLW